MVYQIQTKFRDEARPRGGLIRVREFMMKDAYSFHINQNDLEDYYERCYHAYERVFNRVGIPEVISVASDSGMMGGKISHEFMLLTPIGEDSIVICKSCNYKANMEAADSVVYNERDTISDKITLVETPNIHTIEEVCEFFNVTKEKTCKAVVYQRNSDNSYIVVFIRGDLDINETKLTNHLGFDIHAATIVDECELAAGFIGPYLLKGNYRVLYDKSLEKSNNLVCGGNVMEYHYTGLDIQRDIENVKYYDFAKIQDGGICPCCGIGIGRLAASVCEVHHDDFGPIWPMAIAPWQVHICAVRADDDIVKKYANNLYDELLSSGIEVIYDDRAISAGVMFSDADLLGIPLRIIVSPRNLKENYCEIVSRDKTISMKVVLDFAKEKILELVQNIDRKQNDLLD